MAVSYLAPHHVLIACKVRRECSICKVVRMLADPDLSPIYAIGSQFKTMYSSDDLPVRKDLYQKMEHKGNNHKMKEDLGQGSTIATVTKKSSRPSWSAE